MAEDPLVRVVVADGDPEVQARFVELLAALPGVAVQVPVSTADELSARLRAGTADVALVAEQLGPDSGLELCSRLGLLHPDVHLLFTAFDPPVETILLALDAGAVGVVVRERGPDDAPSGRTATSAAMLGEAVRSVREGGTYLDPRIADRVIGAAIAVAEDKSSTNGHL